MKGPRSSYGALVAAGGHPGAEEIPCVWFQIQRNRDRLDLLLTVFRWGRVWRDNPRRGIFISDAGHSYIYFSNFSGWLCPTSTLSLLFISGTWVERERALDLAAGHHGRGDRAWRPHIPAAKLAVAVGNRDGRGRSPEKNVAVGEEQCKHTHIDAKDSQSYHVMKDELNNSRNICAVLWIQATSWVIVPVGAE